MRVSPPSTSVTRMSRPRYLRAAAKSNCISNPAAPLSMPRRRAPTKLLAWWKTNWKMPSFRAMASRWSRSSATGCRCAMPRVAVAESCTGGLLAERITSISGSSRYFLGGAVVYSNQLKTEFAGVPEEMIHRHGAVSREVAAALAEGIRYRCESTLGVGITGVAGPAGGTAEKPVGLVFHAVASDTGHRSDPAKFPG